MSNAKAEYRWIPVTDRAAFAPRDGAGALVHQGRMWLLGGWNPGDKTHFPRISNNEIWSSTDGRDWRLEMLHAPWEERHCAGYVKHRGRLWIVGGDSTQGHYQGDVWSSADGLSWEKVLEQAPWHPRVLHYTVAYADRIWVMGGQASPRHAPLPASETFHGDVWSSADGVKWERVAKDLPWGPRSMMAGSIVFQNRMWILSGGLFESPRRPQRIYYNDVWNSADGVNWNCINSATPWSARQFHDAAIFDNRIWVLEGWHEQGGNRNDVWHSADGIHWSELPGTPWNPRHAASVFVYDQTLWMVAGNNMESDVWKLVKL